MKKNYLFPLVGLLLMGCSNVEELSQSVVQQKQSEALVTVADAGKEVTAGTAASVANTFFGERAENENRIFSRATGITTNLYDNDGNLYAYLINYSGEGWVIVSATKDFYPILAYSDRRDAVLAPEALSKELGIWANEVSEAIKNNEIEDTATKQTIDLEWQKYSGESLTTLNSGIPGGNSPEAVACRNRLKVLNETYYNEGWSFQTLSSVSDVNLPQRVYDVADQYGSPYAYTILGIKDVSNYLNIGPLLSTEWEQENDYNAMCPDGAKAGCVPVAMAQIMNFHKFPNLFDWANMEDDYATYASQYLIWQIGVKIGVNYGEDETSASNTDARDGFREYGYTAVLRDHDNLDVSRELSTYRHPIYMAGKRNIQKGHAWVCDGVIRNIAEYEYYVEYLVNNSYNNLGETLIENPGGAGGTSYTRFHYNWGWGRDYIGWYIGVNPTEDRNYHLNRQNIYVNKP